MKEGEGRGVNSNPSPDFEFSSQRQKKLAYTHLSCAFLWGNETSSRTIAKNTFRP